MDSPAQAPREGLGRLFTRFLRFGLLAWGGPVAQIAMVREELVDKERWMEPARFNRTLAVYQALPGPEAHELCVHFGMLSRGRIGGLLAGLGFMLPGFVLMLLASWAYLEFGLTDPTILALLVGFQPAVAALVTRAAWRLGSHALHDAWLLGLGAASAVVALLGVHFLIVIPIAGLAYMLVKGGMPVLAGLAIGAAVLAAVAFAAQHEALDPITASEEEVAGPAPSLTQLAVTGLKAGLLTFGGAYTAIPFVEHDAVGPDGWLSTSQFLDGIGISGILPAPLIIFTTFVGYLGGGFAGALVMTAAVFLPAFAFTLLGFERLERAIANERLHGFLDGVTAAVIGLIAVTALGMTVRVMGAALGAALFLAALFALTRWTSKWAVPGVVVGCALAGYMLAVR